MWNALKAIGLGIAATMVIIVWISYCAGLGIVITHFVVKYW